MNDAWRANFNRHMPLNSDDAPGGIIVYYADGDEEIIHVNQYVIDLFECDSVEEFMELTNGTFKGFVHSEDIDAVEDSIWGQVENQENLDHIYYRILTKSGRLVNVVDYGRLVEGAEGRPLFYVFIAEMRQSGMVDWLTGLPSMFRFYDLAEIGASAIRGRGERPVAIALDLVGLKSFNTEYGRDEGDRLLCAFADVIRKHFGSEASSRFGEDHFYAFSSENGISRRMEKLFDDFPRMNEGRVLPIRAGAYICEDGDDIVAVGFDRAKIACDQDKKTWRSHVVWFTEEMRYEAQLRIHVLAHIDEALRQGRIRPYYQAIIRSSTGYCCGEEALARWLDPEYGTLAPAQFVPVLEEAGLLQKLDMHMVECVLEDMKKKQKNKVPVVPVSVNISLRDLGTIDIASEVLKRVYASGVPCELIRVEFTESAASDDPEGFRRQVTMLRDSGIEVWMDDFGSGYSSLNTLQEFDFDLIKLDMSLAHDIENEKACKIVAGIVDLSTKLGLGTLAEGIETREQAIILEGMGCNMLQGFYYTEPLPLEIVMERFRRGLGLRREEMSEFAYWNAVGDVDLMDPISSVDGHAVDGTLLSEFPAGIMEHRGEDWFVLRANPAYREFLAKGGVIPLSEPALQVQAFKHGVDIEYSNAAERSLTTGMWERVAGRLEYGTGLQFYTRLVDSTSEAQAFVVASVPNMLGTALGTYGDVPVAYAVLKVVYEGGSAEGETDDESADERSDFSGEVLDVEYLYANTVYCDWCNYSKDDLAGRSFLDLSGDVSRMWFSYCDRAVRGETVHDIVYSPKVGHWLSFNMGPSPVDGCCVFAFTIVDDEHREREEIIIGRDTSNLIVDIANVFNRERRYEAAMGDVLERVSQVLHPERLYIFERGATTTSGVFEWCAEGIGSRLENLQDMDNDDFSTWYRVAHEGRSVVLPDIAPLAAIDYELYQRLHTRGIERIMAIPLRSGEDLLGFLVADNYSDESGLDTERLLETVASFISARMANQHLVDELEAAGTRDSLTGLYNRRGIDQAIAERLEENPDAPYVLALMDVDNFKTLNDALGHSAGDEILKSLASLVKKTLSPESIIGRNGGDEFLAMLFGDDVKRADSIFEEMSRSQLGCFLDGVWHPASMSIGYIEYPLQVSDLKSAYSRADAALYDVKLSGKASFSRYSPDVEVSYRSLLGFSSRDITENIPGGIMIHRADEKREILFVNDELREMLECDSLSELMEYSGGVASGVVHPDDLKGVRNRLNEHVKSGAAQSKTFTSCRLVTKTGKIKHVAANSRLVSIDKLGDVFYVIAVDQSEPIAE